MKFGESKFVETALVQERTAMVDTPELSAVTIFAAENFLLSDLAVIAGMRSFTKQLHPECKLFDSGRSCELTAGSA